MLYAVAVFAPLFGSIVAGLFGKAIGDRAAMAVSVLCMILASICGVTAFITLVYEGAPTGVVSLGTWVEAGQFHASWALRYDALSAVMVAMVTTSAGVPIVTAWPARIASASRCSSPAVGSPARRS